MSDGGAQVVIVACSVFRSEIERLQKRDELDFPVRYLDSMLHMRPHELEAKLEEVLAQEDDRGHRVVLLYGDCHARMHEQGEGPGVVRVPGINCPEILLGRDLYRRLRRDGVFFLLPEWTLRWREVFHEALGDDDEKARELLKDMHTRLLYLDTGVMPVPTETLEEISAYAGLPCETMHVEPGFLKESIRTAVERMATMNERTDAERDHAVFATMAFDILERTLSESDNPGVVGHSLCQQMRELTGAAHVLLIDCSKGDCEDGCCLQQVQSRSAERLKSSESILCRLASSLKGHKGVQVWRGGGDATEAAQCLAKLECGLSIAAPLDVGQVRSGVLLLLNLPDERNLEQITSILSTLSTVAALVFRNAMRYREQETVVAERTQALERKMEEIEHLNKFMMGREKRIIEVKQEVNALLRELGRPEKYVG